MQFIYSTNTANIGEKNLEKYLGSLHLYLEFLNSLKVGDYSKQESFLNLCLDEESLENILQLKDKLVSKNLKYIFVIGIGGSNLGLKAIYSALGLEKDSFPKVVFLDTIDVDFYIYIKTKIHELNNLEDFLVCIITKSGKTTETIANAEILISKVQSRFSVDWYKRIVVITDKGSILEERAKEKKFNILHIPKKIGGRFSVFTAVGLFVLACLGLDVFELLKGARQMRKIGLSLDVFENICLQSAIIIYENYLQGKIIYDNFFFKPSLEDLGKWYRQLIGESLGKQGLGLTPTISIGTNDLHSVAQLYLGGKKDKFTCFIKENNSTDVKIDNFLDILPILQNKTLSQVLDSIYSGVVKTYEKQKNPFVQILFNKVNLLELGEFLQFKMMEVIYLAKLFGVNPFDQPQVELYKENTRKILENL